MDLETTIVQRYTGEARIQRLLWVVKKSPELAATAYTLLETCLKESNNVQRYKEVFGGNSSNTGPVSVSVVEYNATWVHETETANRQARDALQSRLQTAQSHLNKDLLRSAYTALAEHDAATGNLAEAFHSCHRAKDYCTSVQQTCAVSLFIIELSLQLKNYASVKEYVTKLEHTVNNESAHAAAIQNKVWTASGLERLAAGDFAAACNKFSAAARNGFAVWPSVLSAEDATLYASFLSLAVQSREQMVALAEHPDALELVPCMGNCLQQFGRRAAYQTCWKVLDDEIFSLLKMDYHMALHLGALQQAIREKCILQYWAAYQRVELSTMTMDLSGVVTCESTLLALLVDLIRRGKIKSDTRIDMQGRIMIRDERTSDADRMQQSSSKLRKVTRQVLDDSYSSMIRLACLEHDLVVTDAASSNKRRGTRSTAADTFDLSADGFGGRRPAGVALMADSSDDELDTPMADFDEAMNPEDLY